MFNKNLKQILFIEKIESLQFRTQIKICLQRLNLRINFN